MIEIDEITAWKNFRGIGNSGIVKATVIIPLLGYLILFNTELHNFISKNVLTGQLSTSISPRLSLIYFGLCFIAFASTLFGFFCPHEVKKHASFTEYLERDVSNHTMMHRGWIQAQIKKNTNAKGLFDEVNKIYDERPAATTREQLQEREDEIERTHAHIYYNMLDESHPALRYLITFSYSVGFGLLLIPAGETFIRVVTLMPGALASIF
jgi:hypothetical protein